MMASILQNPMKLDELLDRSAAHPVRGQFVRLVHEMYGRGLVELVRP